MSKEKTISIMQKSEKLAYYVAMLSLNLVFLIGPFKRRRLTFNDLHGNHIWLLAFIPVLLIQKWRIRENKYFT